MDSIGHSVASWGEAPHLREKVQRLEALESAASLYVERLESYEAEIKSLRETLELPNYGRIKIVAPIYGFFPNENRITIGAGKDKQVRKGSAVVCPEGLVGVVQVVDSTTSQVQLLSSPLPFKIGALVEGQIAAAGLLHGEGPSRLILEFSDPSVVVKTGNVVFTSGFSERIPRGIPIGKVVQVVDDKDFGKMTAQVYPFAHVSNLKAVTVLR